MRHAEARVAGVALAIGAAGTAAPVLTSAQALLTPATRANDVVAALSRSTFVFTAVIESRGGTTTSRLAPSPANFVVRIRPAGEDTILRRPKGVATLVGRRLTIIAPGAATYATGSTVMVFASYAAGDTGLALRANAIAGVSPATRDFFIGLFNAGAVALRQERVRFAVQHAAFVALVRVDSLRAAAAEEIGDLGAAVAPWMRAVMSVTRQYKPHTGPARVVALVPAGERAGDGDVFPLGVGTRLVALFRPTPAPAAGRDPPAVARGAGHGRGRPPERRGAERVPLYLSDWTDVLPVRDTGLVRRAVER